MSSTYTSETTNAYTFCLWALALVGPELLALTSHVRRLSAPRPRHIQSTATYWLVLYGLRLVTVCMAAIGVGFGYTAYQVAYPTWIASVIAAAIEAYPRLMWAFFSRPDSNVTWADLTGLVAAFGLALSANIFMFMDAVAGRYGNYLPPLLYFPFVILSFATIALRVLEQVGVIKTWDDGEQNESK